MKSKGFTLIEVIMVSAIMALVVIPTYRSFSFSSNSFEKGLARNTTMQAGQYIINILRSDLSAATLKFEKTSQTVNIYDILKSGETGFTKTYEFYSFAEPVEVNGTFARRLNKIKYVFDGEANTLTRTIYYNDASVATQGRERTLVIGKDVNHFELQAVLGDSHDVKRSFFRPFFQLVEKSKSQTEPGIREFMTTIIPETFNSILMFEGYNRNFHTDPK